MGTAWGYLRAPSAFSLMDARVKAALLLAQVNECNTYRQYRASASPAYHWAHTTMPCVSPQARSSTLIYPARKSSTYSHTKKPHRRQTPPAVHITRGNAAILRYCTCWTQRGAEYANTHIYIYVYIYIYIHIYICVCSLTIGSFLVPHE